MTKIIVLDCDGVLIDYITHFGQIYNKVFNKKLDILNHKAYYPENHYSLSWDDDKQKEHFFKQFDAHAWRDMQALPGAIEATQKLKKLGYKIIVLTSIPNEFEELRHQNLLELNIPVDATIACGYIKGVNNKKPYIEAINPEYFVDDLITNFKGIDSDARHIFIDHEHCDILVEKHEKIKIHKSFSSLENFVAKL